MKKLKFTIEKHDGRVIKGIKRFNGDKEKAIKKLYEQLKEKYDLYDDENTFIN